MQTVLILIAIIVVLLILLVCAIKSFIKSEHEKHLLEDKISRQNKNIAELVRHQEEIQKILSKKEEAYELLSEATTDEEIASAIDCIISNNNNRVQEHS